MESRKGGKKTRKPDAAARPNPMLKAMMTSNSFTIIPRIGHYSIRCRRESRKKPVNWTLFAYFCKNRTHIDAIPSGEIHSDDFASLWSLNPVLHLHRLHNQQSLALAHALTN